ncbi:hypothetical protein F5Y13DRAFT_204735, partial [Hypoxylon sp. FL1857]
SYPAETDGWSYSFSILRTLDITNCDLVLGDVTTTSQTTISTRTSTRTRITLTSSKGTMSANIYSPSLDTANPVTYYGTTVRPVPREEPKPCSGARYTFMIFLLICIVCSGTSNVLFWTFPDRRYLVTCTIFFACLGLVCWFGWVFTFMDFGQDLQTRSSQNRPSPIHNQETIIPLQSVEPVAIPERACVKESGHVV